MIKDNDNMKQYSEPQFPVQEAWKSMQQMLDKEMPIANTRKKRFVFFWLIGFSIIIGGIYFYNNNNKILTTTTVISNNKDVDNKLADNNIDINDNGVANATAITSNEIKNAKNTTEEYKLLSSDKNNTSEKTITVASKKLYSKLSTKKDLFGNIESFTDLRMMKISKGDISSNNPTNNSESNNYFKNDIYNSKQTILTNEIEEQESSAATVKSIKSNKETKSITDAIKAPKEHFNKNLEYGLQWNILLPETNSYLNYNAKSQPLSVIIPEFWVNKNISKRSAIGMQLNPYSQYTLQNNNVLSSNDYSVTVQQGSSSTPTTINYVQTRSLLKAMGTELTAKYTYKINNKFSVGIGFGNTWLNAAVVNDKLLAKDDKFVHDSLYGVAKGFKDWDYLKSSFLIGRLEFLYQLKKLQIGVAFVKPLENIYTFSNTNKNPVNGRLVLRWKIK